MSASDASFCFGKRPKNLEDKSGLKSVDNVQGQGKNRFKSGAYTLVFEHFESVFNDAIGR
jgi:hypothetical protein